MSIRDPQHSADMRSTLLAYRLMRVPVEPARVVDGELLGRCESDARSLARHWAALAACLIAALLLTLYAAMPLLRRFFYPLIAPTFNLIADLAVAVGLGARNGAAVANPVTWFVVLVTAIAISAVLLLPFWLVYKRLLVAYSSMVSVALALERDRMLPPTWDDFPRCHRTVRSLLGKKAFEAIAGREVLTGASS